MGQTCSRHGSYKNDIQNLVKKSQGRGLLMRSGIDWRIILKWAMKELTVKS
jgi:hypothetical protein